MITVAQIKLAVAGSYGMPLAALEGASQHRKNSVPRQLVMFLGVRLAGLSAHQVAARLVRHHTTVLHGIKATDTRIAADADFRARVTQLLVDLTTANMTVTEPAMEVAA